MAIDLVQSMFGTPNVMKNGKYDVEYIDINKIRESNKNFYNTDEFNELKLSIEISGLRQNIEVEEISNKFKVKDFNFTKRSKSNFDNYEIKWVRDFLMSLVPTDFIVLQRTKWFAGMRKVSGVVGEGTDTFKIISGHRRFKACRELFEAGNEEFKLVPCRVVKTSSVETEIQLISGNAFNRVLSDYEEMVQVVRLSELLEIQKEKGNAVAGGKRKAIMDLLNLSKTKVGDLQKIGKDLSEELKEEFKKQNIDFTAARALASQDKEFQNEKLEEIKQGKKVTKVSIDKELKEVKQQVEPKQKVNEDVAFENQLSIVDQIPTKSIQEIELIHEKVVVETEIVDEAQQNEQLCESTPSENTEMPIMGTNIERVYISDKEEMAAIESIYRKYTGKLSVAISKIENRKKMGREPLKDNLDEQMELQLIVQALELLKLEKTR